MTRTTLTLAVTFGSFVIASTAGAWDKPFPAPNQPVPFQQPQFKGLPQMGPNLPGQPKTQQLVIDPNQPNGLAYFSPRLGARFLVGQMYLPQFGSFWGARIVSQPEWGSPLRKLGLREGDIITRLDGVPITSPAELERHTLETGVRFLRTGSDHVFRDTLYIRPGQIFQDPYAPLCGTGIPHNHHVGHGPIGYGPGNGGKFVVKP